MLPVANDQFVVGRAKRTQRAHKAGRFEQIGLPLAVGADEKMLPAGKFERSEAHVAKMPEREFAQLHAGQAGLNSRSPRKPRFLASVGPLQNNKPCASGPADYRPAP